MENKELEKIDEHIYYSEEDDTVSAWQKEKKDEPDLYLKVRDSSPREIKRKDSPFVYHQGSELLIDAAKERKGMSIISAFETGMLTADAKNVISMFAKYKYLNAHLIKRLLSDNKDTNDEYVKKILAKLYKLGIVVRIKIQYVDNEGVIHTSSFIYSLSAKYKKIGVGRELGEKSEKVESIPEVGEILSRLALNQFAISINEVYGQKLALATYKPNGDGIQSEVYFKSKHKTVAIGAVPIRLCEGWENKITDIIGKTEKENKWLLFLVETEVAAIKINNLIKKQCPEIKKTTLYICDYATNDGIAPFEWTIFVEEEQNYKIVNIEVD